MNLLCEDTLLDSGNTGQTSYFLLEDLDQTTFSFSKMKEYAVRKARLDFWLDSLKNLTMARNHYFFVVRERL